MRRLVLSFVFLFVLSLAVAGVALAAIERYSASLSGAQETPPVVTTAQGSARLAKVSDTRVTYSFTVSNIDNVTMAHIHLAPRGVAGQVVVNLRAPSTCTVGATSITCQGTITRARLTGPLRGRPLSALVTAMNRGRTYVNVHTVEFPNGEVRGQIRRIQ